LSQLFAITLNQHEWTWVWIVDSTIENTSWCCPYAYESYWGCSDSYSSSSQNLLHLRLNVLRRYLLESMKTNPRIWTCLRKRYLTSNEHQFFYRSWLTPEKKIRDLKKWKWYKWGETKIFPSFLYFKIFLSVVCDNFAYLLQQPQILWKILFCYNFFNSY